MSKADDRILERIRKEEASVHLARIAALIWIRGNEHAPAAIEEAFKLIQAARKKVGL